MESLLIYYLIIWSPLGYLLAFVGAMFEGDAVWFTFAFLTSQGFFDLLPMLAVVWVGAVSGDLFFYFLGKKLEFLPPRLVAWANHLSHHFDGHIKKRPFRTLLISKFAYGIHRPILMRYGMLKIPLREFIKDDLVSVSFWMIVIGLLGYFSGASFYALKEYIKYVEIGLVFGLFLLFILMKIISHYSLKEI